MKNLDLQNVVLQLHEQGLSGRKISDQLVGQVSKATVNRWIKIFQESGKITLKSPPGPKRTTRTTKLVKQVKQHLL